MKVRIFYAFLTDNDEVLSERRGHLDFHAPDDFRSDYCKEQVFCQSIVNQAVPHIRLSSGLYKPVVQHWVTLYD